MLRLLALFSLALNLASLAIVSDVAASNRGMPTRATTDGLVTYDDGGDNVGGAPGGNCEQILVALGP